MRGSPRANSDANSLERGARREQSTASEGSPPPRAQTPGKLTTTNAVETNRGPSSEERSRRRAPQARVQLRPARKHLENSRRQTPSSPRPRRRSPIRHSFV